MSLKTFKNREAFTLIEMIIAITVFTIFIGFAISAYLTFHRADQDALTNRSLLMDAEAILNELSDATRENKINYDAYASSSSGGSRTITRGFSLPSTLSPTSSLSLSLGNELNEQSLYLISPDGEEQTVYSWNADEQSLSVQRFDASGTAISDAQNLNSDGMAVTYVNFRIFPDENPYDASSSTSQFQPMVTFDLSFSMPGRMDTELTLDLKTTVTSRFYQ